MSLTCTSIKIVITLTLTLADVITNTSREMSLLQRHHDAQLLEIVLTVNASIVGRRGSALSPPQVQPDCCGFLDHVAGFACGTVQRTLELFELVAMHRVDPTNVTMRNNANGL